MTEKRMTLDRFKDDVRATVRQDFDQLKIMDEGEADAWIRGIADYPASNQHYGTLADILRSDLGLGNVSLEEHEPENVWHAIRISLFLELHETAREEFKHLKSEAEENSGLTSSPP